MRIPDEVFEDILRSNDIVDVISSYVTVKRRGKSFVGLCPFHPDKNPSMHISQAKQVYHCFSCKAGGNVITFVQEFEKISPIEAVEKLAQRAGINLGKYSQRPDLSNEIARLFEVNRAAARYFYDTYTNLEGEDKKMLAAYLKKRDIDRDTVIKFGLGYSKDSWHGLESHFLDNEEFTQDELAEAGLLIKSEKDGKYHDRFRGRLMFPIFNEGGKVVGFGGRILKDDKETAKYINSPETKIYLKSKILYGLNFARDSIRSKDYVILTEGYLDVISLYKNGIHNVVSSSGTALTSEQVHLISRYTKNIVLIYDADVAGIKAAKRGIEIILEQGLELSIVTLPDGEDPDSFVRTKGAAEFEKQINKKKSVITFISDVYKREDRLNTPEEKTEFIKEIIGYIVRIPDRIKISFYVKEIAEAYKLYESDLRDELNRAYKEFKKTQFPKTSVVIPKKREYRKDEESTKASSADIDLIRLLLSRHYDTINYIVDNLYIDYIKNQDVLHVVEKILDEWHNEGSIDEARLLMKIENKDEKEILLSASTVKHEITPTDYLSEDNILTKPERTQPDYFMAARDVIFRLKIEDLETKINEARRNRADDEVIFELLTQKKKLINEKDIHRK
jgi:DNA primase